MLTLPPPGIYLALCTPARPQRNHYICLKIRRLQVRDNDHEPVRRALCHLTDAADQGLITAEPLHKDDKSSAKISPPKPLNLTSLPSSVRPKPFERSAAGNHVCYLPWTPPPAEMPRGKRQSVIIASCMMRRRGPRALPYNCATTEV